MNTTSGNHVLEQWHRISKLSYGRPPPTNDHKFVNLVFACVVLTFFVLLILVPAARCIKLDRIPKKKDNVETIELCSKNSAETDNIRTNNCM